MKTEQPLYGAYGVLDYIGDWPVCHLCGVAYESLASHIAHGHGLTANEYKAMHGLPRRTPLWSLRLRQLHRGVAKARNVAGSLEAFKAGRTEPHAEAHLRKIGEGRRIYLATHPEARARMSEIAKQARKRPPRGVDSHFAKLTEEQVLAIRQRYDSPERPTQRALAKEYGVTRGLISLVVNRKVWAHL